MPEVTLGGFAPEAVGVGQMKLEAPPQYSGKRQPGVRVWLIQMKRYMRLMLYVPTNWLDVVAMRVEGRNELLGECCLVGYCRGP